MEAFRGQDTASARRGLPHVGPLLLTEGCPCLALAREEGQISRQPKTRPGLWASTAQRGPGWAVCAALTPVLQMRKPSYREAA